MSDFTLVFLVYFFLAGLSAVAPIIICTSPVFVSFGLLHYWTVPHCSGVSPAVVARVVTQDKYLVFLQLLLRRV